MSIFLFRIFNYSFILLIIRLLRKFLTVRAFFGNFVRILQSALIRESKLHKQLLLFVNIGGEKRNKKKVENIARWRILGNNK